MSCAAVLEYRQGVKLPAVAVDGLVAAVLGGLAAQGSWSAAADRGQRLDALGFALVAVAAAALVVRRRWPIAALLVSFGATMTFLALGNAYGPIFQLAAVAMYSVAAWCSRGVSSVAVVLAVGTYVSYGWWDGGTPWPAFPVLPFAAAWLVLPWAVGLAVGAYRRIRARAAAAERRGYLYEERLRIAREVHDVVGHSLAVINLQAGVALHVLDKRPQRVAEALRAVRQTSAEALAELRATLDPLSTPENDSTRSPAPGLDRVADLVAAMAAGGVAVRLVTEGTPTSVPAGVGLAGYRIVQESLTNVVRHAGTCQATVHVCYGPRAVTVTVSDDGRGLGATGEQGGGRGVVGMRERARAVGGTLQAGACPGGGFEVRAVLPCERAGAVVPS